MQPKSPVKTGSKLVVVKIVVVSVVVACDVGVVVIGSGDVEVASSVQSRKKGPVHRSAQSSWQSWQISFSSRYFVEPQLLASATSIIEIVVKRRERSLKQFDKFIVLRFCKKEVAGRRSGNRCMVYARKDKFACQRFNLI